MKIIKRNGAEVPFDITKIITAVTKASDSVGGQSRLTKDQITQIAADVTDQCQALNRAVSVEEVQDMVENQLMDIKAHDIARHYITYRYIQSLKRQTNTTDERILSLIECQNEEVKQENANKNPTVNSVQRDYMAGEISKDLTARLLLDPEIVKAHPRTVAGVRMAATLRETASGEAKLSVRAVPGYDAARIAAQFGGGGHKGAAGANMSMPLADAAKQVEAALNQLTIDNSGRE